MDSFPHSILLVELFDHLQSHPQSSSLKMAKGKEPKLLTLKTPSGQNNEPFALSANQPVLLSRSDFPETRANNGRVPCRLFALSDRTNLRTVWKRRFPATNQPVDQLVQVSLGTNPHSRSSSLYFWGRPFSWHTKNFWWSCWPILSRRETQLDMFSHVLFGGTWHLTCRSSCPSARASDLLGDSFGWFPFQRTTIC